MTFVLQNCGLFLTYVLQILCECLKWGKKECLGIYHCAVYHLPPQPDSRNNSKFALQNLVGLAQTLFKVLTWTFLQTSLA